MAKQRKFCPRCGKSADSGDSYCIKCGHSFTGRRKSSSSKTIIIALIVILVLWVGIRLYLKQPIIPEGLIETIKNIFAKKAG